MDDDHKTVLDRMRGMSAADLSMLEAACEALGTEEEVRLTTVPGSANDALWSEIAKLGWMTEDAPLDVPVPSKMFVVCGATKSAIEDLLNDLKRDALPKIFNDLRRNIPPQVGPPVIAAGGAPGDVVMMLAGIVEATMQRYIKPELHEEFLRAVADRARDLSKEGD